MTFRVKDGLTVGNNTFVNSNLDVNANNLNVSNTITIGNSTVNSSFFSGQSNSSLFAFGKSEETLDVNSSVYAVNSQFSFVSNNSTFVYGKQEGQLSVANAVFATTANNALRLNGKQESQLSVANAVFADTANNSLRLNGKQESQLSVAVAANAAFATSANAALYANYSTYATYATNFVGGSVANAVFADSANNALYANNADYLDGLHATYFTNATNISTGTLAEPRLPYRMDQNVRTVDSVEFKNLVVTGNVYFSGNATLIQTTSIATSDALLYLNEALAANVQNAVGNGTFVTYYANNNFQSGYIVSVTGMNPTAYNISYANNLVVSSANSIMFTVGSTATGSFVAGGTANAKAAVNPDVGLIAGVYVSNTYTHTGIIRDATDATYKVFDGLVAEPTGAFVDIANARIADFQANVVTIASANVNGTPLTSTNYGGTANNATYAYGKQESQLYVANAVFATTANNALYAYGKQESQLSVSAANNAAYLQGRTWESPGAIGATVANTGNFSNVTVAIANTTNYLSVRNIAHLSGDSNTTSAIAQVQIASFSANTYGSAKIYIQATETTTTRRHVTEILVVHDNTTASATEYGMLFTDPTALATYEVDISGNNVRVLATPASANTIAFRVSEQLFTI